MYSYDDRIRAVKLYIKLGKRVRATIRQPGYPTKNSLKDWYREYEQSRDLQGSPHRRPMKKGLSFDKPLNLWCAQQDSNPRPLGS